MPDILIRNVANEIVQRLGKEAERHRRSREKHALFLIERGLADGPFETAGELAEAIWSTPAPNVVSDEEIDNITGSRGRRSHRP